ncbi:transcriptional regulator [Sulfodiicoccus acidiphilus]|uniref:Transcriptional regulator n=1 Tax=Sulfodiicoccus acidiphilus TaxID=1670455 RepID=A0A348B6J4_9CREN|nr:helix-turn-helix domain-containing protein [Sulfodiicoccus acidiphilus]BBD73796.1 transcriptional regulator [Sulfodiicoccus acidiphilus]GGU03661.1 transcriptional regulator [Sulfodiicoccus acidiphilus]
MAGERLEEKQDVCPIVRAIRTLGSEPKLLVVRYLLDEPMGFNQLLRVTRLSSKTLSSVLKSLEEEGIVKREVVNTRPFAVRYSLTEKGADLNTILRELGKWLEKWERFSADSPTATS